MALTRSHRAPGTRPRRLPAAAVCGLAFAALVAAGPLHADAPMFRGNSGLTGVYSDKIDLPLALSWRYTSTYSAYNPSSPAVVGDTAYFASGSRIYAVDTASGALKWRYPGDQPLATTVSTSPAYYEGFVYCGANDGKLHAINAETGKVQWIFDTRSSIGSSPTVVDGTVYFGSGDGRLWAVDCKSGAQVSTWKGGFGTADEVSGAPAVSGGTVFALSLDQVLHAVSTSTGKEKWQTRLPASVLRISPVVQGDSVFVGAGSSLNSYATRSGVRRWGIMLPADIAVSPAVNDQALFVVTTDNRVYSYDLRMGRPRWRVAPELKYEVMAPPAISGNLLLIGTVHGGVYAIDTETGSVKWVYMVEPSSREATGTDSGSTYPGGAPGGPPGMMGPGGLGGRRGGTGTTETASQQTYANVAAAPVVANDALFIVSDDGSLSCFRSDAIDTIAPIISDTEPDMGATMNGAPPVHFEAQIEDQGSGVDPASVRLLIDDEGMPRRPEGKDNEDLPGYHYDPDTGLLQYDTPEPTAAATVRPLADGQHTVKITATDWKGNVATKTWTFVVDNSLARLPRRTSTSSRRQGIPGSGGPGGRGSIGPGGRGGIGGSGGSGRRSPGY